MIVQLGTRWSVGEPPPQSLPAPVVTAIGDVESELVDLDTAGWRWTLTYLERRPVVELDDGTVVRYDPATDAATISAPED